MATPVGPNGTKCHFLALPPELRTRIYERVLVIHEDPDKPVYITRSDRCKTPNPPRTVLLLLATCRQVNAEASGIFYNINNIAIGGLWLVKQPELWPPAPTNIRGGFLQNTSAPRLAGFRRLTISTKKWIRALSNHFARIGTSMPRLQTVTCRVGDANGNTSESRIRIVENEEWWLLKDLPKVPTLEEVVVVVSRRRNGRQPFNLAKQGVLEKWAKEVSEKWSKKTGQTKTFRWEFK